MKKIPLLLAIACSYITLLPSCRKEIEKMPPSSEKKVERPARRSPGDGKFDVLGYGYDVTGEYANSSASKFSIINVEALQRDQPTRIETDLSKKQTGYLVTGENAKSYLEKRSQRISGGFGFALFKKALTANFYSNTVDSVAVDQKHVYGSYDLVIQQKRLKLNASIKLLRRYLQASFQWDVEEESPEFVVKSYGTHFLTDVTLGAKLQIMYQSETSNLNRAHAAEAGTDVSVGQVFKLNVGTGHTVQEAQSNSAQFLHYKTYGGDPSISLIGQLSLNGQVKEVDIRAWQASSSVTNAELIDFTPESLIPIYELIEDSLKREAVKNYTIQYLKEREVKLVDNTIYIRSNSRLFTTESNGSEHHLFSFNIYDKMGKPKKTNYIKVNYQYVRLLYRYGQLQETVYEPVQSIERLNIDGGASFGIYPYKIYTTCILGSLSCYYQYYLKILPGSYVILD